MTQRGQAVPLVAAALVVAAVIILALASGAHEAVDAARARTAADAAALAGAAEGRPGADRLARANGGRIVRYETDGSDVVVTVAVGGVRAAARARPE